MQKNELKKIKLTKDQFIDAVEHKAGAVINTTEQHAEALIEHGFAEEFTAKPKAASPAPSAPPVTDKK